jgi:hypothetical protein
MRSKLIETRFLLQGVTLGWTKCFFHVINPGRPTVLEGAAQQATLHVTEARDLNFWGQRPL